MPPFDIAISDSFSLKILRDETTLGGGIFEIESFTMADTPFF